MFAYDVTCLAVGQLVSFDLEDGIRPRATNVSVQRRQEAPQTGAKRPDMVSLRYVGFDQKGSLRTYKFERIAHGQETRLFVVVSDLTLFSKYHVGMQEGPALCLRLLMAELHGRGLQPRRILTDQDMLGHIASRPVPPIRPRPRRVPRPSVAVPHSH